MKKLNIIYGLLAFVFLVSMCSCGARKVNKSQSKEETTQTVTDNSTSEKQSESNVKETTAVKTDDKNETVTEETIYEPNDPAKESFMIEKDGTKVVLNNIKKTVKKTTQKNNTAVSSSSERTEKQNNASKEQKAVTNTNTTKKEIKSKQVDKKQFNPFVSVVIGMFGLLVLWCIYIFYKKLPLVPKL
jgi:FtsZ-interacting cell division protein ZipA